MRESKKRLKKYAFYFILSAPLFLGTFLFFSTKTTDILMPDGVANLSQEIVSLLNSEEDIGPQKPLTNPPSVIKAVYATGYSAGNNKKLAYLLDLMSTTELNAIVIDIKDFSGIVTYNTDIKAIEAAKAEEKRIPRVNALIKKLHDQGIYVIGRIAVFEDQKLPLSRPDLALKSKATGDLWTTKKGLYWLDTASEDVWDYNIALAQDILDRGFDEVNFDYIRFASDGNLGDIQYPVWDGKTSRRNVIKGFYKYVREKLPEAKLSADLFGMVTTNNDDLGIGQVIEDALPYFDAVAPMVYPSHYISGFLNIKNPAQFPYEVVKYSLDKAVSKVRAYETKQASALALASQTKLGEATSKQPTPIKYAKLRPWFQDFNLGATYDAAKVRAQIKALADSLVGCFNFPPQITPAPGIKACDGETHDEFFGAVSDGWMLWNPSNVYTKAALKTENK